MTTTLATGTLPTDLTPAKRTSILDMNSAALQDRADAPPNPQTQPTAGLINNHSVGCVAALNVSPTAQITVRYSGGAPIQDSSISQRGASLNSSPATFTVVRTAGGGATGDVFIYWPANTLPLPNSTRPQATLNGAAPGMICADYYTDGSSNYGVRVVTLNAAAAATDLPFTVSVY